MPYKDRAKRIGYCKQYRQNNREKISESRRQSRIKNKEKIKEQKKKYYITHKEQIRLKNIERRKNIPPEKMVIIRQKSAENVKKKRNNLKDLLVGSICKICKYNKRLICHRKDGQSHEDLTSMKLNQFIQELQTNNYVRLCFKCHKHVHWCMKYLKMSWNDISNLF